VGDRYLQRDGDVTVYPHKFLGYPGLRIVAHTDVNPHRVVLVAAGQVVGVLRDVDGIEPEPQADGDSRDVGRG